MKLAETKYDNSETGCCARLDAARWDGQRHEWQHKRFLKDHVRSLFHIPLNYGAVMTRSQAAIERAAAYPEEPIWLTDEVSLWGADIYFAVDREVPGAAMAELSGTFITKVFDGPFSQIGKWNAEMRTFVAAKGETLEKIYYFYATCPECARRFGKNQVVLFGKITAPTAN